MRRSAEIIQRDAQRLAGVHPDVASEVGRLLIAMDALDFGMFITEGLRSDARQKLLYAQGRETPGPIVTYADGVEKRSKHQKQGDGYAHAVDLAFLDDPQTANVETYDPNQPWDLLALMAEKRGLVSGYRWRVRDSPHVEKAPPRL